MPPQCPVSGVAVCYGYTRVSTDRQYQHGLSLEDQQIKIKEFYDRHLAPKGARWGDIYQDGGVSGDEAFYERPAGKVLSSRLRPGDHIVVTKLDRAFRNLRDFLETTEVWMKAGIKVHMLDMGGGMEMATDTPHGELIYTIFAALAQMYRRMIRENCAAGFQRRKEKYGTFNHRYSIGWKNAGTNKCPKKVPDDAERRVMALITHLVEDCRLSFPDVHDLFEYYDFLISPAGSLWSMERLRRAHVAYVREAMTEPCCEFPPPADYKPRLPKLKSGRKAMRKRALHPKPKPVLADWLLLLRVKDSTIPLRAMRLLSPTTELCLPPLLPGQVVPLRASVLARAAHKAFRPSNGSLTKPTPELDESDVSEPSPACDAPALINSTSDGGTSSPTPNSPTSS